MKINLKWTKWIAYAAVLFLVNSAASTLFFRVDLTKNGIHSLSNASIKAVANLEEPLTIKAFLSENLPTPHNNLEQEMGDLLEAYGLEGNKFFNYSIHIIGGEGPDESEESRASRTDAQSYGIYPIQIQKVETDEIKLVSVFMGMVFIQGDIIETIPVLGGEDNREVVITSTIQKMSDKTGALLALENDVGVKLYLSSSLVEASPGLSGYADSVAGEVRELNRQYYGRLNFRRVDPDNPAAGDKAPDEYNLSSINLQGGTRENPTNRRVYASLVIENGETARRMSLLKRNIFGGYEIEDPTVLTAALPGVVDTLVGMNPKIGYLTDKGAPDLYGNSQDPNTPGMNNLRKLLGENYTLEEVSLDEGIPEDILTLLVVSPKGNFTEWELFQLDQYLIQGNSLAFFIDSMDEIRPQGQNQFYQPPTYQPRNTGLEPLLAHYGFTVEKSYILDENCFRRTTGDQGGGVTETLFYFAPLIGAETINEKPVIMGNIKNLILLNNSPVKVNAEAPAGISPVVLFSSSPQSWVMKDDINLYNPTTIQPPPEGDRLSQQAAALAAGTLTSYFKGRSIPEPPDPEEPPDQDEATTEEGSTSFTADQVSPQEALIESGGGKVFVLGSSTLLMDNVLDEGGSSSNATFLLNLVDVLSGREDYARMRSKGQTHSPLEETSATVKRFVKGFNIVGLPILMALLGIIVWLRGLSRKRRIELLFTGETEK